MNRSWASYAVLEGFQCSSIKPDMQGGIHRVLVRDAYERVQLPYLRTTA